MKVTSRIATGYAILIGLIIGLIACEVITLHRMQAANRRNSGQNLQAVLTALQLMRDRDMTEDCARQYFSSPSDDSQSQLKAAQETFEAGLVRFQSGAASEKEQEEAARLMRFWKEFLASLARMHPQATKPDLARQAVSFAPDLQEQLERLRAQSYSVYEVSAQTIASEAEASRKAGDRAETILWISTAIALVVALFVFVSVTRSISIPLRHLVEGTRALTEGKEFYRLDTSRDDEFSQIAKDFNELIRRLNPGDFRRNLGES